MSTSVTELQVEGDAVVTGAFAGRLHASGVVTIGASASVEGEVAARVVTIEGLLRGRVTAREEVRVRGAGQVVGEISAPRVLVEAAPRVPRPEGTPFEGPRGPMRRLTPALPRPSSLEIAGVAPPVWASRPRRGG